MLASAFYFSLTIIWASLFSLFCFVAIFYFWYCIPHSVFLRILLRSGRLLKFAGEPLRLSELRVGGRKKDYHWTQGREKLKTKSSILIDSFFSFSTSFSSLFVSIIRWGINSLRVPARGPFFLHYLLIPFFFFMLCRKSDLYLVTVPYPLRDGPVPFCNVNSF